MKKIILAVISFLILGAVVWAGNVQLQGQNSDTGNPQIVNMNVNTSSNVRISQTLYATTLANLQAYTSVADGTLGYVLGSGINYVYNGTTGLWSAIQNQVPSATPTNTFTPTITQTPTATATPPYAVVTVIAANSTPVPIANTNVTANAALFVTQLNTTGAVVASTYAVTAVAGTGITFTQSATSATTWRGYLWY